MPPRLTFYQRCRVAAAILFLMAAAVALTSARVKALHDPDNPHNAAAPPNKAREQGHRSAPGATTKPRTETFTYECDITDEQTGEPIPGVRITWSIFPIGGGPHGEVVLWQREFVTDEAGRYEVHLPTSVLDKSRRDVWIETSHADYLPIRDTGYTLRRPEERVAIQSDHRHLKLRRGVEVTGRFVLPDGSPAGNLLLMVARNRYGFGDGRPYYARTDAHGRYRLLTRPEWPQRLHWFPDDYVSDSRALLRTDNDHGSIRFGDQGTIHLKPGPRIEGRIVDGDGVPLAGVAIRATCGTRIPLRYAISDDEGRFAFSPLPPGDYTLRPVAGYLDQAHGGRYVGELPTPFTDTHYILKQDAEPALIRAPATVRVRVQVVDGEGRPLEDRRFSVEAGSDPYPSKPVPGEPGYYELEVPRGLAFAHLWLTHRRDEATFYHRQEGGPPVPRPGERLFLGNTDHDISGIRVVVRKAGTIRLRVRSAGSRPLPRALLVNWHYLNGLAEGPADVPVNLGRTVFSTFSRDEPDVRNLLGIAPDMPVIVQASAKGFRGAERTVDVGEGRTIEVQLVLETVDSPAED